MTLTVLFVANSTDTDPGYVGERLLGRGYARRDALRDQGGLPADLTGVDAVVLLGSEWSVHSPVDPAALAAECELVRAAQASGVPVLGLCYGAQVVAHALGGTVSLAAVPEVGFVEVITDDSALVPAGPWAQFHLDVIEPPPDARVVAQNACGTQAFVLPGVLAVQFHPEVRPDTLDDWSRRFPDVLVEAGLDRETLVAEARDREPAARSAAYALVDAFLDRVGPQGRLTTSSP
ncbi:MAG: gamma-glutamyl-gamma-aminobutyrate hydrolase family protein [Spirochaetaceae bacterium]|nr:gamma-glutamyl-gamma-aminobutyrate hydrolase family protein [Spirochaetaceae bacterium]